MRICLSRVQQLLAAAVLFVLAASPVAAQGQAWDAFVYYWTRVYSDYSFEDIYNCPADDFNSGNPVEVYLTSGDQLEDKDRFRFTFDGASLCLNRPHISTVGFSSSVTFDLVLSGEWAVCGSLVDSVFVPDPYATFTAWGLGAGSISWDADTPLGHTTSLLLGQNGSISIRKHPTLGGGSYWEQWRTVSPYSFAVTASDSFTVPECQPLFALAAYLASAVVLRRRRL